MSTHKKLTAEQQKNLINTLQKRFEKNMNRHKQVKWEHVLTKLQKNEKVLWTLHQMEESGGEPDVISPTPNDKNDSYYFFDCSPESPAGRRSICYDQAALDSRKEHKPKNSATGMAAAMGIEILSEEQYRTLQQYGKFDTKTSSWIQTPSPIRKLGGAVFCDYRYGQVFLYHNGAESYYAARGFRGLILI